MVTCAQTWHMFCCGVFCYLLLNRKIVWPLAAFYLIGVTLLKIDGTIAPVRVGVLLAIVVAACQTNKLGVWLKARPFQYFGRISYSLYLVHGIVGVPLLYFAYRIGVKYDHPTDRLLPRGRRPHDRGRRPDVPVRRKTNRPLFQAPEILRNWSQPAAGSSGTCSYFLVRTRPGSCRVCRLVFWRREVLKTGLQTVWWRKCAAGVACTVCVTSWRSVPQSRNSRGRRTFVNG